MKCQRVLQTITSDLGLSAAQQEEKETDRERGHLEEVGAKIV